MTESVETRAEIEGEKGGDAKFWHLQLDLSERDHKNFIENGREIVKRYKSEERRNKNNRRINILYSNTETLKAAIYARQAKPDVRRRFSDQDPIGRQVAEVIERALSYCNDYTEDEDPISSAIDDYLLPGRGVVRIDYEPTIQEGQLVDQELTERYWYWEDFRHEPARRWSKINWIGFRWLMSRDDLIQNFGDKVGNTVPLGWTPDLDQAGKQKIPDAFKRAEVWEIWDKTKRQRVWVVKGYPNVLRTDDDPYGLSDFYPVARPLQATVANDTFIPEPELSSYKDQADGLDEIENRIDKLTRALKRRGVYDDTIKELNRLANAADNQFIPVKNYTELMQKGGLKEVFQSEDITMLANVLKELHVQRDLRVQAIYEITGISDIFRGATDPNETLGAQEMKANYGGARLKKRQDKIQKWIRDTLRIKAELLAEHFEPQKLQEMTGITIIPPQPQMPQPPQLQPGMPPEAMQQAQQQYQAAVQQVQQQYQQAVQAGQQIIKTLRSDKLRSYRVDIETDSTIFEDAQAEKQSRTELLTAMSQFVEVWFPIIQAQPALLQLAFEMLSVGVRAFKPGRMLEDVLEQTKVKLEQAAQQAAANPKPPDPKVQAEQIKAQAEMQRANIKAQTDQQKAQLDMQAAQQKHQMEMEKLQADLMAQRAEIDMMMQKLGIEREAMMMDAQAKQRDAELNAQAAEHKHELGIEMMDYKAQQAKRKPEAVQ